MGFFLIKNGNDKIFLNTDSVSRIFVNGQDTTIDIFFFKEDHFIRMNFQDEFNRQQAFDKIFKQTKPILLDEYNTTIIRGK